MSAGLKARIEKYLPQGCSFMVKDIPAALPPACFLPELRTEHSYLCQSCIKTLNALLKDAETAANGGIPPPPSINAPAGGHSNLASRSPIANAPMAVAAAPVPATVSVAPPTAVNRLRTLAPEVKTEIERIQEERRRIQEERSALQEERSRFLNDRQRVADEKERIYDELHRARLDLRRSRDESKRLQTHIANLCEELTNRFKDFARACDVPMPKRPRNN